MIVSALATVAAFLIAMSATATAVGLLVKSPYAGRPLRWLWKTNVSGPIGRWNHSIVAHVVDDRVEYLMHHRNNGSSLLDLRESVDKARAELVGARRDINLLLKHDDERDTVGQRYGPEHLADSVAEVEDGVELLLEHDAERDTPNRRYGPTD